MRLHDFIRSHREQILMEWETFARSCAPASITMDVEALRDHASAMLSAIAADLASDQSAHQQSEKSRGRAPTTGMEPTTAAEEHGAGRAESGFTVEQMVAEYRALRASVIRLWTQHQGELKVADIDDLTRFNEAIDQSLAESVGEFTANVENAKEMFLAMLGHDLRTPLGAIYSSARFMLDTDELGEPHRTLAARIASSATRTTRMVGDLLDFTRSRLGGGIPIVPTEVNLGELVREVVDEVRAAHPDRVIYIDAGDPPTGAWDGARISQALINLIGNAVEHGTPGAPVIVGIRTHGDGVAITVHNRGSVITAQRLDGLFNPMKAGARPRNASARGPTGNLGLGLYIAERIANAHGGRIEVESSAETGTTFTVHLPHSG